MKTPASRSLIFAAVLSFVLALMAFRPVIAATPNTGSSPSIIFADNDSNGADSPGDEILFKNDNLSLRFRFVDLSTVRKTVELKFNGYFLSDITYRGEKIFTHPDWKTENELFPSLVTNDVVGMSAFIADKTFRDAPFLWMWNNSKEPIKGVPAGTKWVLPTNELQSYEWYTLYPKHEERNGSLVFISARKKDLTEELSFSIKGSSLRIEYSVTNKSELTIPRTGLIVFPVNRIISTVYAPKDILATRDIEPICFSDKYTCSITKTDGLAGSGMTFWSRGEDSLLHMDGMFSWHNFKVAAGTTETRYMEVDFHDRDIRDYYLEILKKDNVTFDTIDWDATEKYMISKVPLSMDPKGFVYHAYDYNPPGTAHDWHNEMTGRAFIVQYLATGDKKWLDYANRANTYYIEKMFHSEPHTCHGYFYDQTYADKTMDCYLWSQPYNVESLIAEYAVTKDKRLKDALLLNLNQIYEGPLYNKNAGRWYWQLYMSGTPRDFATFDAQEFGIDSMIQAYEFTGDRKYLTRAVDVLERNKFALDNFGLLLEDRAGEPSVNTFAFAAKVLFKLYEYTGNKYYHDRAIKILDATVFSRVFMQNFAPEDAWLKGALARKDGDWKGQRGEPSTGTDSSAPSETTYIPWVMEALIAGYNHTGDKLYLQYIEQLLHHQLEANKKLLEASGGKFELCGHYNMLNKSFEMDNDGLTVVSNLFLFPYMKAFKSGIRSPHSSVVLLPGDNSVRAYHLSGITETVRVISNEKSIVAIWELDENGKRVSETISAISDKETEFEAAPYTMYEMQLK